MQKWEYMILNESLQGEGAWWEWADTGKTIQEQPLKSRLDEMGSQGWELVSVSAHQEEGNSNVLYYFFKRPVE